MFVEEGLCKEGRLTDQLGQDVPALQQVLGLGQQEEAASLSMASTRQCCKSVDIFH